MMSSLEIPCVILAGIEMPLAKISACVARMRCPVCGMVTRQAPSLNWRGSTLTLPGEWTLDEQTGLLRPHACEGGSPWRTL